MPRRLKKERCEIEGCDITDPALLHAHHIIERTEIDTSNHPFNLAVLCSNHHNMLHHTDRLEIIGVYPSTAKYGRTLIYKIDGKPNVEGIEKPYFIHKPKKTKITHLEYTDD